MARTLTPFFPSAPNILPLMPGRRSEEHTSELQSQSNLVCRLLLEKKNLEPSLGDRDHVYAGVEDAALFESKDGGKSWQELSGLRQHDTGPKWQPGAGGMCLHTILLDPKDRQRMFVAISAAGAFRTDDGGKTWRPINRGLHSEYIPDPAAEVGHCVHRIAMHPSRPNALFMQKHWDVMRTNDAGDSWQEVSDN